MQQQTISKPRDLAPGPDQDWRHAFQDLPREHGFERLRVEGRIPEDLVGTLYRNGPALFELFGRRYGHWFDGDGAVSAVRFGPHGVEGAIQLVQSAELQEERRAGRPLYSVYGTPMPGNFLRRALPKGKNAANTSVFIWQDRLFALYEADKPTELAPEDLSTLGTTDLDGVVPHSFSAHPHRVPERRATYNFGVRYGRTTELDLFELTDQGGARRLATLPLGRATMIHDFMATPRHLIFFAPPIQMQTMRYLLGQATVSESLEWQPSLGTEVLIVPIDRPQEVTRFVVDPFFQWHFANAFERDEEIVVDLVRYPDFASNRWLGEAPTGHPTGELNGTFQRAVISGRTVRFEQIAEAPCEFPRIAPSHEGQSYRYAYVHSQLDGDQGGLFRGLSRVDVESGRSTTVALGVSQYPSEPIFVPRPSAATEDDGYLLTLVYDAVEHQSHVAVLDAQDLERGPLARAWFDHHIPFTFHGVWAS